MLTKDCYLSERVFTFYLKLARLHSIVFSGLFIDPSLISYWSGPFFLPLKGVISCFCLLTCVKKLEYQKLLCQKKKKSIPCRHVHNSGGLLQILVLPVILYSTCIYISTIADMHYRTWIKVVWMCNIYGELQTWKFSYNLI